MKKRTAAMLVIIFAAAFLLGADLSFFDVHLHGKARRVLNDMLPENTSYIVPIIDGQTNNSSAEGESAVLTLFWKQMPLRLNLLMSGRRKCITL